MASTRGRSESEFLDVVIIKTTAIKFHVIGQTPLIIQRMSEKAKHELLMPTGRKTVAERAQTLKHDPIAEFRSAAYQFSSDLEPTRLYIPGGSFKRALREVALRVPGASKTEVGQLTRVIERDVAIYGIPQILMCIVRNSDQAHTPDVRSRPILPQWAATVTVRFNTPPLTERTVGNLLANAGQLMGVGDWRQQKGNGDYGLFELVNSDDPRFLEIVETGGRDAQDRALADPECYDDETIELLSWFESELEHRGLKSVA